MIAAGARLVFLAGGGGAAGDLLVSLAAGSSASSRMVTRSTLGADTAAVHLMYDTGVVEPPVGDLVIHQAGFMANMGTFMNRV